MTETNRRSDGPNPLNRRDILRLSAASAGAPLLGLAPNGPEAPVGPAPSRPQAATPVASTDPEYNAKARKSLDNLRYIGLALSGFNFKNEGRFPAATISKNGRPLLSWRVAILPYLDIHHGPKLFARFHLDEPWDSPHNLTLLPEMPDVYAPVTRQDPPTYATYYQAFVGPGTLFGALEGVARGEVTDSLDTTIAFAEGARPVPWTKPEDIPFDPKQPLPQFGGQFADDYHVSFPDGSARFIAKTVAPEILRALITRNDGRVITFKDLGPWRSPKA